MLFKFFKIFTIAFCFSIFLSINPVLALDVNDEYPSPMWGVTSVTTKPDLLDRTKDQTFYSQSEGNLLIRN